MVGTIAVRMSLALMGDDSERFRMRAKQCRELARIARDEHSRKTLNQMAIELDEEANKIEAEEATHR